ncbi:MAG: helix-turn-helix transcriptional regulator [Alphaproteobacteria bacterium]|nr:helix-turn-helix transcriptional regulator [Alphaproteobacteria bacterium]
MRFGEQIANRLRVMRRVQKAPQDVVAQAVGSSISAVSRLERGLRSLRVDQLVAWAGALGYRIDVVFWKPTLPEEIWDKDHPEKSMGLDDDCADVLAEVASALPHMPEPARKALVHEMRLWREEAARQRGIDVTAVA